MRDDAQWLTDIIEAIERIERYSSRGRDLFERDELVHLLGIPAIVERAFTSALSPSPSPLWPAGSRTALSTWCRYRYQRPFDA